MAHDASVANHDLKRLRVADLDIAYLDCGQGETVIVAHCSSASHREWLPLIHELAPEARVLAPDLIGYGRSESWPAGKPFAADADVRVLTALADLADGPVHLVGHSYGAALALEAARELGPRVKSLSLVEPVAFHLLRQEQRPEWAEVERLGNSVLSAIEAGDDRRAAASFMGYWLGRFRWFLSPERFKAAVTVTIRKVALEFGIMADAKTTLPDYATIDAPVLLVAGIRTRRPARAVVDLLQPKLPRATLSLVKGAGHMSPFTHPAELNRLIRAHLSAAG